MFKEKHLNWYKPRINAAEKLFDFKSEKTQQMIMVKHVDILHLTQKVLCRRKI